MRVVLGTAEAAGPPRPRANPFGAAKPVDTASKLKEIEEKAAQMKKEHDEAAKHAAGGSANTSADCPYPA